MARRKRGAPHYSQTFGIGDPACSSSLGPSTAPEFAQHPPSTEPDCGTGSCGLGANQRPRLFPRQRPYLVFFILCITFDFLYLFMYNIMNLFYLCSFLFQNFKLLFHNLKFIL